MHIKGKTATREGNCLFEDDDGFHLVRRNDNCILYLAIALCFLVMAICCSRGQWFGGLFQILPIAFNISVIRRNRRLREKFRNDERTRALKGYGQLQVLKKTPLTKAGRL